MGILNNKDFSNKLSGRYEIIEQVGVGGMSYVYKAFDSKKKRIVAIKILKDELALDEEFVNKFKSEAVACKEIVHENVIRAYDVVDDETHHYIVMEYIEGKSLNKYIKEKGCLSNEETIKISLQMAKGIEAAHKKGIIHRDIKPQNVVITNKGVVKITDFGIARAVTSTTRNISVVGTVHYISPEQVRNTVVDFRSDIYSFGCTMYEMITGVVPFQGESPLEIIISHLRENIDNPRKKNPKIYGSLEKIIIKSTHMIPMERYQSIGDMINDLKEALIDKNGSYIKETNYDDDEEGKTVIISEEDMKVIKAVSERYSKKDNYSKNDGELTKEQQEFFNRYIKKGAYKYHRFMQRLILVACILIIILIASMFVISVDTKKNVTNPVATGSVIIADIPYQLSGVNVNLAREFTSQYGISIVVDSEEFSEEVGYEKIIRVTQDNHDVDKTIHAVVSKGGIVLDFSNVKELNETKFVDMEKRLKDRDLKYSISEINDMNIPRGFIVGVNKSDSSGKGDLIFTVSRGISDAVKVMPDFYKMNISEVRDLLAVNGLILGDVSFIRDYNIEENCVIKQSIKSGTEVKTGTSIDLTLSCGRDGVEYFAESKTKWFGSLSNTYQLTKTNYPNINTSNDIVIIQIRLKQVTENGIVYSELVEPQEYKIGTVIPLVFESIEGVEGIQDGAVEIVDVQNDVCLSSYNIVFKPENK